MIGEVLGSYRLISAIGRGGMGVVYSAEHVLIPRKVAVKLLLPEMSRDADLVDRFFNEARAAAIIQHPGLVAMLDYGHHSDGSAYIVMELLSGESLAERLAREKRLSTAEAALITRQIAGALHAAHGCGIVHRDLKPENVYLVPELDAPGGVRVKVLDFGIAKLQRTETQRSVKTKTGAVFGTPRYMAPEQCKNAGNVDGRADVYALGCILYEMLLGRAPFDYDNWGELVAAHIHERPPPPRSLDAKLPEAMEQLLLKALAKSVDDRFPSMAELAEAAEAIWVAETGDARARLVTPLLGLAKLRPLAAPSSAQVERGETMPLGGVAGAAPTLPITGEMTTVRAASRSSRAFRIAALSVAACAAITGALVLGLGNHGADRVTAPPSRTSDALEPIARKTEPTPVDAAAAVPTAPTLTKIELTIESNPSGADVYRVLDGVKLGKTPLKLAYDQGNGVADLVIKLPGYRDSRVALPTSKTGGITARLVRAHSTVERKPTRGSGSGAPHGATVLDPFGGSGS